MAAFVPAASVVAPAVRVDAPEIVMESVLAAAMDVRGTVPEIAGAVPDVPEAVLVLAAVVPVPAREHAKTAVQQAAPALVPVPVQATGTCSGGCQTNCQGQCDNACTADSEAEIIAHLGDNIAIGHIVMAMDYTELKNAMDNEYRRRGKEIPSGFIKQPIPGEPVSLEITQKVLTDVYEFDKVPEHDWRETFGLWDMASAPKWNPVIVHIKSLMTDIATS